MRHLLVALLLAGVTACSDSGGKPETSPEPSGDADATSTAGTASVPSTPDLYGKVWRPLRRYVPDVGAFERRPSTGEVRFKPNGKWAGSDGCNRAYGAYELTSGELIMSGNTLTDMGCANMYPEDLLNGTLVTLNATATLLTATDVNGEVMVEYVR